jgi:hypothetical protein
VQGGYTGPGNINTDPLLDLATFHLTASSPCIDTGNNSAPELHAIDFERDPRILDGLGDLNQVVDMGADEFALFKIPSTYASIQQAINASWNEAIILVEPRTYMENIDFLGKAISLLGTYGAEHTVIDGNASGSVVTFESGEGLDSLLDGFTLRNGKGGDTPDFRGGGVTCIGASPTLRNLIIQDNSALYAGGGICCRTGSNPAISDIQILDNDAEFYGGGIFCQDSAPEIKYNKVYGNVTLDNGGIGGGIACWQSDPLIDSNCIQDNEANAFGGGIGCWYASPVIVNNLLWSNHCHEDGGGLVCLHSTPTLTNNTFYANSANSEGGGIYCLDEAAPVITNTILWNDTAPTGPEIYGTHPVVTFCDVQGGWPGASNIDVDPAFVNAELGDFHLQESSPCVDAGNDLAPELPVLDFEGEMRIYYDHVDLGMDEYGISGTVHLVPVQYAKIQDAIDTAASGDLILVAPGTYLENIDFNGKDLIIRSDQDGNLGTHDIDPENTVIDGGQPASYLRGSVVIFDHGESSGAVLEGFTITNGQGTKANSVYCGLGIFCEASAPRILNNIITENRTYSSDRSGGGLYCGSGAAPWVENNIFTNNRVSRGGAISCGDSAPLILDNFIEGNHATSQGGGIYCSAGSSGVIRGCIIRTSTSGSGISLVGSSTVIENNTIEDHIDGGISCGNGTTSVVRYNLIRNNTTEFKGGGISCFNSSPVFENNIISGNHTKALAQYLGGGGIFCQNSSAVIAGNVIYDNTSDDSGGGICFEWGGSPVLTNNTVVSNSALQNGGGLICDRDVDITCTNTIFWGNDAPQGPEIALMDYYASPSTLTISYSDVEGGLGSVWVHPNCTLIPGAGLINEDPLFADLSQGNFHLTVFSPCINAGDNSAMGIPDKDFDGDPRIATKHGGLMPLGGAMPPAVVDMGADEFYRLRFEKYVVK